MASEGASQLVILGNGFDLKLGLATKFEDYLGIFSIDKDVEKLNKLFNGVIDLSSYSVESLKKIEDERYLSDKVDEIIDCIDNIKINIKEEKKLVLNFYIKIRCDHLKEKVIPYIESLRKMDSKNSIEYDNRIKFLKKILNKYITDTADKNQLDFWDGYFLYLQYLSNNSRENLKDWSDIEYQILKFYKENNGKPVRYDELISSSSKDEKLFFIFKNLIDNKVNLSNADEFLYKELLNFSRNFINYLKNQYSQCYYGRNDYKLNSRWKFIDEKIADSEKYELLNFNYTNAEGYGCIKQIHIHGNKDKHNEIPIIGINAEDLTSNKEHAFKLTKQYQLISSENNKVEKLDLENIKRIVFYGHSLALADYQYFRNIFDRINLVKSSVQLIFKYSKGYENYDSIFRLLDRYSKDIDIDITTTLTLENRLKVEEIPD